MSHDDPSRTSLLRCEDAIEEVVSPREDVPPRRLPHDKRDAGNGRLEMHLVKLVTRVVVLVDNGGEWVLHGSGLVADGEPVVLRKTGVRDVPSCKGCAKGDHSSLLLEHLLEALYEHWECPRIAVLGRTADRAVLRETLSGNVQTLNCVVHEAREIDVLAVNEFLDPVERDWTLRSPRDSSVSR